MAKLIKVKSAQPMGEYKPTAIDIEKKQVDFRVTQMNPVYIIWKDGTGQTITKRQLAKLQKVHSWTTDF